MQAKRGFVQILPLVLLGVFAVTTIIITNNARQQSNVTRERSSAACSADKPVYCGGCIAGCYSYAEIGQYGGGCQAMIDARCNQPPTVPPQPTAIPQGGNPPAGGQPAAPCGNWNVSCNNGEGFSTTDCVVIRDYFGGDENRWKTEACQNRCGVIGSANTCGQGGPPTGGQGGGPTADEKAKTCETGGPTASACYGVTVGNRCTGFNGTCINNGGLNSDGYAVCGCRADAAPTQRLLATATSRPIEPYCDPTVFADCRADGHRCIPDRDGGYCEAVPTRVPPSDTRTPTSTSRPQATATARPSATRIPPSPTTATRDDYFTRLPTATRVPSATPTIRFVERENVYNSPTPGIGSGYRCGNTYRGRCTGQGLICDRTPFGQIDCASGQTCVPIAAVCRTPAAPTNTLRPTSTTQPTLASRPASPTACAVGLCYPNGCPSSVPYKTSSACTLRDDTTNQLKPGVCCTSNASLGVDTRSPTRTPFPTAPPGYWITTPDVGRPSPTAAPRPTVDLSAVAYCSVGTSSFYRPCNECAGGATNVEYPFGQTSSLRRCRNGYGSGSTYPIISPTPTVSYDAEDYRTSLRLPTTYQPTNVVTLEYGDLCYAPNDPPIPGLNSCLGCPNGGRYTRLDTTNNPVGTSRCSGGPQPTQAVAVTPPDLVQTFERDTTTVGNAVGDAVSSSTRTVTGAITDLTSALSVLSCSVWNSLQVAFGGERVDCNSRFYR